LSEELSTPLLTGQNALEFLVFVLQHEKSSLLAHKEKVGADVVIKPQRLGPRGLKA